MDNKNKAVIGIGVGSGIIRARIFDLECKLLTRAVQKINVSCRSDNRVE
ncbi:hypothetical protein [Serratia marcescens]